MQCSLLNLLFYYIIKQRGDIMYCQDCGSKIKGNENFCPNCGFKINNQVEVISNTIDKTTENRRVASIVLGIISLCGVFFWIFAPIALVISIIGLILAIIANRKVNNSTGIVLNAVGLFLSFVITAVFVLLITFSFNIIRDVWDNTYEAYEKYEYGDF